MQGAEIEMLAGEMYLSGHESGDMFEDVRRDFGKFRSPGPDNKGVSGLPMFSDPEPVQCSLF
jgi:hypothetical protein